jgi:hypothetical protein
MDKIISIVGNIVLYGFLLWQLSECIVNQDWWFTYTVGFAVVLAVVISVIPKLHAPGVTPGEYPYED